MSETYTVGHGTGISNTTYVPPGSTALDPNYSQYCGNRLPCGVCRLTNSICPLEGGWKITPTWGPDCTISTDDKIKTQSINATIKE